MWLGKTKKGVEKMISVKISASDEVINKILDFIDKEGLVALVVE